MESKKKSVEEMVVAKSKIPSLRTPRSSMKTKTIKQKQFISAKPVEIYDALLNEQKHSAFTGAKATCDRRVGGKFTAWDGYITGKNVKLENGRRIIQEWKTSEWPQGYPPSLIEFTFKPKAGGKNRAPPSPWSCRCRRRAPPSPRPTPAPCSATPSPSRSSCASTASRCCSSTTSPTPAR